MNVNKKSLKFYASPKAVIANYLLLPGSTRIGKLISRVALLSEEEVNVSLEKVLSDFGNRHRDIKGIFLAHVKKISNRYADQLLHFTQERQLLLGAFFTKEYSIQAAALFNPSIVPHPDQAGLKLGTQRFIMSLRATGEGHISSIIFKTGIIDEQLNISLDEPSPYSTLLNKNDDAEFTTSFMSERLRSYAWYKPGLLDEYPEAFTAPQALNILTSKADGTDKSREIFAIEFKALLDSNYDLYSPTQLAINEKVIFPHAAAEKMGMEDIRFVKFEDEGKPMYYGSYTAYNGSEIKSQLIETADFDTFKIRTLYGDAISDKGMALFPEKVNGKYVMISRQGGENLNIMYSGNLYCWDNYEVLLEPSYNWEMVQIGNCGSPIKTDAGWLLLTHGVGIMRTYVISVILLDLNDPSKIIGRLNKPLIQADETEREGYVPNVVYTCGLMQHGKDLLIPYAVSDSATGFVTVNLQELLRELTSNNQL